MSKLEKARKDGVFRRAYEDTAEWSGKLYFLIGDVLLSAIVGFASDSGILGLVVFLSVLLLGFTFFLERAPVRQRDELRVGYAELEETSKENVQCLQAEINDKKPNFVLRQARNVGHGLKDGNLCFLGELMLCNTGGSSSVVTEINANAKVGGVTFPLQSIGKIDFDNFSINDVGGDLVKYKASDLLEELVLEHPIEQGECKIGLIVFAATNNSDEQAMIKKIDKFELLIMVFTDAYGEKFEFRIRRGSEEHVPRKDFAGSPALKA